MTATDSMSALLEPPIREARIELLQRMPIFGGIRADILQFLLELCPLQIVQANEFFFRERDQADSMFVLEAGKAAVLKSWQGRDYLLRTTREGDCFGEIAVMDMCPRSASERTRAGLASARARGRKGGRKPKMTPAKLRLAQAAMRDSETNVGALCEELGITRSTLYRHLSPTGELRASSMASHS